MTVQNLNLALNQLPEYIKLTYTNHAIDQSLKSDRQVFNQLPDKVKKPDIVITKTYFEDNTLVKVVFQVDIGLKNLALEIVYLPIAKQVKTVYKTKKR